LKQYKNYITVAQLANRGIEQENSSSLYPQRGKNLPGNFAITLTVKGHGKGEVPKSLL
jgi:hypothetical protein